MYPQFAVEVALCGMVLTVHRFRCYSLLYLLTRAHNNWIILLLCPCHFVVSLPVVVRFSDVHVLLL
jgi:hypothetical protein